MTDEDAPVTAFVGPRGLIYFAEAIGADRIKIGFTSRNSARARVSSLQTGCPFPIRLLGHIVGTMATETHLHDKFGSFRVMPNAEWFHATAPLRDFIGRVAVKA